MKNNKKDKKASHPKTGVFYLVPDPKSKKFTLYPMFDFESNDEFLEEDDDEPIYTRPYKEAIHIDLWRKIIELLRVRFKKAPVEILDPYYRGLPRGRVGLTYNNNYTIFHGNDFSLDTYKDEILYEFSLKELYGLGKVKFEVNPHEKMLVNDRNNVERVLKIKLTPRGIK